MTDPKRLLDEMKVGDAERRVLSAGKELAPPAGMSDDVWRALCTKLPPLSGDPTAGADTATAAKFGLMKAAALGLTLAGLVVGGTFATKAAFAPSEPERARAALPAEPAAATTFAQPVHEERRNVARDTAPAAEPESPRLSTTKTHHPPERVAVPDTLAPSAERAGKVLRSLSAHAEASDDSVEHERSPASTRAREESKLIDQARSALRAGDPNTALDLLRSAQQRFRGGILVQEREALMIEALLQTGQRDSASTRAERFLRSYPKSPHASRVRALSGIR